MATAGQSRLDVEVIRQYPGGQQVARKVKVQVPGKHSPPLQLEEWKYRLSSLDNLSGGQALPYVSKFGKSTMASCVTS